MRKKIFFVPGIFLFVLVFQGYVFAQQGVFTPRDNAIFATVNQLQDRYDAMRESMKEAQLKVMEDDIANLTAAPVSKASSKKVPGKPTYRPSLFYINSHPYITQTTMYDDNPDSVPQNKTMMVYGITPGVKVNLVGKGKTINIDAQLPAEFYGSHKDGEARAFGTDILGNFVIGRSVLSLSESYFNDFLGTSDFGILEETWNRKHWQNIFTTALSRHFNKVGFDFSYSRGDYGYDRDSKVDNDRIDHLINLNTYLKIAPKTQLLLQYEYDNLKYNKKPEPSLDQYYSQVYFGFTSIFTPKLTGTFRYGYKNNRFKAEDNIQSNSINSQIAFMLSDRTDFNVSNIYTWHSYDTPANTYTENDWILNLNHRFAFNPKLKASLGAEFDYSDYFRTIDPTQESHLYTYSFTLTYAFRRWLDFTLDFRRKQLNSTRDAEYKRHTITFTTQAKF